MEELKKHITVEELKRYPKQAFRGKVYVVEDEESVSKAVDYLSKFDYIGFDTESRPVFKKGYKNENPIALMQLSTWNTAYLFRINKVGIPLDLQFLLEDPNIIKVGSAVKGDLNKIAELTENFYPNAFVDLQDIAEKNGIVSKGLKKLTAILLGFRISKKRQLTNWEAPTLDKGQISYAATDAWASYKVYQEFLKRNMV